MGGVLAVRPLPSPAYTACSMPRLTGSAAVPAACGPEARVPNSARGRRLRSRGLQYLLGRDVGGEERTPVGVARQDFEAGGQRVIARLDARRGAALLGRLDRLAQQPTHIGDRLVGGAEVFPEAIDDLSHALL